LPEAQPGMLGAAWQMEANESGAPAPESRGKPGKEKRKEILSFPFAKRDISRAYADPLVENRFRRSDAQITYHTSEIASLWNRSIIAPAS
jgi:hypothetical protein